MRILISALVGALLLATAALALATPTEKLSTARDRFREGNYTETIAILSPLLYPRPAFADQSEHTEALIMLGVAYFETGEVTAASEQFDAAILLTEGDLELDPLLYSAGVVELFDRRRTQLTKEIADARERNRLAEENERYRLMLENSRMVELQHGRYYINWIPFGAGQFQNGHSAKGRMFLISEALLGGTSLALFTAQWLKWGLPLKVPKEDADAVKTLQMLQVGTGALFFGVAAWGIIDALHHYQPTRTISRKIDPKDLPPGFELPRPGSFSLLPTAGPDGVGLILNWEF